jgi:hypothetical protein
MLETGEVVMLVVDPAMAAITDTSPRGEHTVVEVTSHHEDHPVVVVIRAVRGLMQHHMVAAAAVVAVIAADTAGETMADIVS